jgi:hypothetical protein
VQHISVDSSNIKSVAHEGDTLEVTFKHGGTYQYSGVDKDTFNGLLSAPSIGKALNQSGLLGVKLNPEKKEN